MSSLAGIARFPRVRLGHAPTPIDPAPNLVAALAVGAALVGSVLRFNAMQLMGAVGVGIAAGAGTGIVTGLVGPAIVCAATSSRW